MMTRTLPCSLSPWLIALLASACAPSAETTTPAAADGTSESPAPSSDGVVYDATPCIPLTEHIKQLAGDGATDCGTIDPGADRNAAWTCVEAAHNAGTPFKVALRERGKDSTLTKAWTRDASGQVTRVSSDSDPTGANDDNPTHSTKPCPQPQLRPKDDGLRYGELFICAATTEPEHRCRSHGFEGQ